MDIYKAKALYDKMSHAEKLRVERMLGYKPFLDPIKPPEPPKAYVVVCGEYSDYSVCAVYLNKEEAERAIEIANRKSTWANDHRILEMPIGVPCDLEKCNLYTVWFNKDESISHASQCSWIFSDETNKVRKLTGAYRSHDYCIDVYATDEDHAKKIAADIFAMWKAEQEGIT